MSWTSEQMRELLATNDKAVRVGIIRLYQVGQTADEQESNSTKHHNGRGFSSADANFLSNMARMMLGDGSEFTWNGRTYRRDRPRDMSPAQLTKARRALLKYAGQLATLANAKENTAHG